IDREAAPILAAVARPKQFHFCNTPLTHIFQLVLECERPRVDHFYRSALRRRNLPSLQGGGRGGCCDRILLATAVRSYFTLITPQRRLARRHAISTCSRRLRCGRLAKRLQR